MAIRIHLLLFLTVSLSLLSYLILEVIYICTHIEKYHQVVDWLRVIVQFFTCLLQTFIAYMLYKLTYPNKTYLLDYDDSLVDLTDMN